MKEVTAYRCVQRATAPIKWPSRIGTAELTDTQIACLEPNEKRSKDKQPIVNHFLCANCRDKWNQTYYEEYGEGPPIVFLHGARGDHRLWAEQIQSLATEYVS